MGDLEEREYYFHIASTETVNDFVYLPLTYKGANFSSNSIIK